MNETCVLKFRLKKRILNKIQEIYNTLLYKNEWGKYCVKKFYMQIYTKFKITKKKWASLSNNLSEYQVALKNKCKIKLR